MTDVETIVCPQGHRHLLPLWDVGCWNRRIDQLRTVADKMVSHAERAVQAYGRCEE